MSESFLPEIPSATTGHGWKKITSPKGFLYIYKGLRKDLSPLQLSLRGALSTIYQTTVASQFCNNSSPCTVSVVGEKEECYFWHKRQFVASARIE